MPRGVVDLSGRIKTEKENDQEAEDWRYVHGFSITDGKITKARVASRTPSSGVATANQKERFQPEFWAVRFDLIPISAWLSGWTSRNSKRNFHRPESNCGMALNSGWRVFIVLQSRLQLQIHQRQSKIATPINGLSAANQKEMFQSEFSGVGFFFMPLFSSIRRQTF